MQHFKSKLPPPRLAIISTHPIQYNAPWFKLLGERDDVTLKVFYTWSQRREDFYDSKFGRSIQWDIPLLEGYDYTFVDNPAKNPGNHHFFGITCPSLIKEIKDWKATHLLVFGWNFKAHLSAMRHFKGKIPILFRGDSTLLDEQTGFRTALRRIFLKWIYRYIDTALYVGSSNKEYYLKHGLKEKQLVFSPHAIDNNRFIDKDDKAYEKESKKWRTALGFSDDDHVILFVGKFETKKDPFLLLEAFKKVQERGNLAQKHRLKLLFAGNGELEEELREKSAGYDISFLDFQNQSKMPVVYRLGDTLCLPSRGPGETWGLVINEALASGTKCIISDKAGCAKDMSFNGNQVFASGNAEELADCLENAVDLSHGNRDKFLNTWNYENIVQSIFEAIKR
ncbi:MAG: glycosyltransferase family 4 protein [Bacteroidota bacterium]